MRKNLYEMFFPKSIAVVGATGDMKKHGGAMLARAIEFGYEGKIYPVNPKQDTIFNLKCYKTVLDIPETPDVAFVVIPAVAVLKMIEECGQKGIKNIVMISAGFKEVGGEGIEREKKLLEIIKKYEMNLVGPNCPGFVNPFIDLHFIMSVVNVQKGGVVILSQSGGITAAMVDFAKDLGIGCRLICGIGNKADINEVDIMETIIGNETFLEGIKVVALYQESIVDADRLLNVARRFAEKNIPILSLKSGRGNFGKKAALSHTGAMASSDVAVDALFKKAGIIRVDGINELLTLAACFEKIPIPSGNRVAIVTNSGGPAVVAADYFEKYGLTLAQLSETTKEKLHQILNKFSAWCAVDNPVDIIGGGSSQMFQEVIELLFDTDDNDIVLVTMPKPAFEGVLQDIAHSLVITRRVNPDKPMFVVTMTDVNYDLRERYSRAGLPIFLYPEEAVKIIGKMRQYPEIIKRYQDNQNFKIFNPVKFSGIHKEEVEKIIRGHNNEFLSQEDARKVLKAYGFKFPRTVLAQNSDEAERYFAAFKADGVRKVVLKVESADILHKSDAGCVKEAILFSEETEPMYIYNEIIINAKTYKSNVNIKGVLIQEFIGGGKEVLIGVKREVGFGHLIAFGRGGIYTEAECDIAFALAPLSFREADELTKSIRFYEILKGVRGEKPVDFKALRCALLLISQLVSDFPQIAEIDINPIKAFADKIICVDVRIKIGGE